MWKGKYQSMNNTINRKRKGILLPKNKEISGWKSHTNTGKLDIFWQSQMSFLIRRECGTSLPPDHIHLLSSDQERICDRQNISSFRVFECDFQLEMSSFFGKTFFFFSCLFSYHVRNFYWRQFVCGNNSSKLGGGFIRNKYFRVHYFNDTLHWPTRKALREPEKYKLQLNSDLLVPRGQGEKFLRLA